MCKVLAKQNYFQYTDSQCIQEQGPAMGAPTSSIFSEIYLQYLENTNIFDILINYQIVEYLRYVDDILIVYKENKMWQNIQEILDVFNNMTPTMAFTMEEVDNSISFIDITISKTEQKISFNIYTKPHCNRHYYPQRLLPPTRTKASSN